MGRQGHGSTDLQVAARDLEAQAHAVAEGRGRIGARSGQCGIEQCANGGIAFDLPGQRLAARGQLLARQMLLGRRRIVRRKRRLRPFAQRRDQGRHLGHAGDDQDGAGKEAFARSRIKACAALGCQVHAGAPTAGQ